MALERKLVRGEIVGPYQLIERLGTRRGLEVWRAHHALVERVVVLELFPRQLAAERGFLARFAREARALSRLHHPNILPVNHFSEHDGRAYLVRPLVGGLALSYMLGEAWPLSEALLVLEPLGAALEYAHARGIAHGDLRASDVLITDDARVLLLGFPIRDAPEPADEHAGPAARGVDIVADLRALGTLAFELLNGRPLFRRETWPAELQPGPPSRLAPPCTLRPELPPAVVATLYRTIVADPTAHFSDAAAVVRALAAAERPVAPEPEATLGPVVQPLPRALEAAPAEVEPGSVTWRMARRRLPLPADWKRLAASAGGALVAAGLAYVLVVQSAVAMVAGRGEHAAVALTGGEVLVVGGCGNVPPGGSPAALLRGLRTVGRVVEPGRFDTTPRYLPVDGRWVGGARLARARCEARAVPLADGRALVVGGDPGDGQPLPMAERYERASDTWSQAGRLYLARREFAALALAGGSALVIGGSGPNGDTEPLASAERYDPSGNRWTLAASLTEPRRLEAAALLADGRVLVSGGVGRAGLTLTTAERWDPALNGWTAAAPMRQARAEHTATVLLDGRVLVVGGAAGRTRLASAERYDPTVDTWARAAPMSQARSGHTATLLPSGQVLVVGGLGPNGPLASAERYDPATDSWISAGSLPRPRTGHTASLLPDGRVLVVGGRAEGEEAPYLATTHLYDPTSNRWSPGPDLPP